MVDLQFYGVILTILFGLLGALLFWKSRSSDGSGVARGTNAGPARRRAAVPIRDEDGQV